MPEARTVEIAIIGAGFTGVGMAIRLRQAGIHDFEILERADDVGGTWRDNRYPGCAVDVQSHLYSYSFAPNPNWSAVYAPREEIWRYIQDCAERFGVREHLRPHHEVRQASWDEGEHRWSIDTAAGTVKARFLISAMGPLNQIAIPALPGLDSFAGACFHSADWDQDHDVKGERVAVIGTGASAAQVVPAIQPLVERLTVYQRTPAWTFPRMNRQITAFEHRLYRRFPALQKLVRARQYWYRESLATFFHRASRARPLEALMRLRLRIQVRDPVTRQALTPDYRIGCKRIIVSDDYHKAFNHPNVELVTAPITEIRTNSILTGDGIEHPIDTIVLATGFHPITVADPLNGIDGVSLRERWSERRESYYGTTVAGYPNYFMLLGPNTATGHTSVLLLAEAQIKYIVECLEHLHRNGLSSCEIRPERQQAFNRDLREREAGTVWTSGGCGSWYLDADGGTSVIWPGYTWEFERPLRRFDPDDYVLRGGSNGNVPLGRRPDGPVPVS
jgi:cation diffusion facilitator CzcD-associated flavoprotein CzcO